MEKNFYTQLEEKVQQNLKKIKQTDPFLYKEMRIIYEMLKDAEYPTSKGLVQGPLARVTEEQAIALVAEFLEKCNPRYKDNLLKDYSNGKIIFNSEEKSIMKWDVKSLEYDINIEKTDTITMAYDLVHEYFHTLNLNIYVVRAALTETVSIIAELMFLEFLKTKGYSDYDLNIVNQKRRSYYNNNLHLLKLVLPLYLDKKEKNTVAEETYRNLPELVGVSQQNINLNLEHILNSKELALDAYKYVIGYLQARMVLYKGLDCHGLEALNENLKNANFKEFEERLIGDDLVETIHTYAKKDDFSYQPIQLVKK
ncbi:MAG TPA: hypothetical protein IAD45_03625 [Candidatus Faecimonas intestinavium]|nr:hypothetical protein [Bacilli bacterium]HIT23487.1 hypothetical protein [Candidatus Faecimonas intestinavium]